MTKPLWSGRFKVEPDARVQRFTRSLHLDRRLAHHDIRCSQAHVRMLAEQGVLKEEERDCILKGLEQIREEIESGRFPYREELEDIHMNIEHRLQQIVGEAGECIHTGRSRNDQIAVDLKLFCLETSRQWQQQILEIQEILVKRAEELKHTLLAAWTHLQAAQPLSWGHYLLAFSEMFNRDFRRLRSYQELHADSPLGAGALAGSTLPLEPEQTARALGFSSSFGNSYDVVGNRDFVLELVQVATQLMLHVSRLAEDFIYFSSTPVGWIELPDALCTGSSMMPQKKNPDLLELARGKTASVLGDSAALASLLKGLPTSYHRDLQQDKEHLFRTVDVVSETLEILGPALAGFDVNKARCEAGLEEGFLMATDLAEYLVTQGVPFRKAHEKVGKLVAYCAEQRKRLDELPLEKFREFAEECDTDLFEVLKPASTLKRRRHRGSAGLAAVEQQINSWKQWIDEQREGMGSDSDSSLAGR